MESPALQRQAAANAAVLWKPAVAPRVLGLQGLTAARSVRPDLRTGGVRTDGRTSGPCGGAASGEDCGLRVAGLWVRVCLWRRGHLMGPSGDRAAVLRRQRMQLGQSGQRAGTERTWSGHRSDMVRT